MQTKAKSKLTHHATHITQKQIKLKPKCSVKHKIDLIIIPPFSEKKQNVNKRRTYKSKFIVFHQEKKKNKSINIPLKLITFFLQFLNYAQIFNPQSLSHVTLYP